MADAVSDFTAFLESLGLKPGAVRPNGKWVRCATKDHPRKRNGSYLLEPDGRMGVAINWATMDAPATWKPGKDVPIIRFDARQLQKARKEARRKMLAATDAARAFWDSCSPLRSLHPYLESHGLDMTGCTGLKIDRDGWLVVPMYRNGHLMSVQRISPDGTKLFYSGTSTKGCVFDLDRRSASLNVLCEGVATGLAIYAAVPIARVRCCFSTSGLLPGGEGWAKGMCVIGADNDHKTRCERHRDEGMKAAYEPWEERPGWCRCNPGRLYATKAAEVLGCGVAWPVCDGTDFSDMRREQIAARRARRLPNERDSAIVRAVDAEIARELKRHAKFIG